MAQQTAVEWFNQQLVDKQNGKDDSRSWDEILEQAKIMENQQIMDAWKRGDGEHDKVADELSKKYYTKTYIK
jgi:predicted DNA-binding ArsR family transcriptional regulator